MKLPHFLFKKQFPPLKNPISLLVVSLSHFVVCSSFAQVPQMSLSTPQSALLGETLSFEVSLDNTDATTIGYDPIVELIMPSLPLNEAGEAVFPEERTLSYEITSTCYLGNPIYAEFVGFLDEQNGEILNPVTGKLVEGPAGSGLYVIHLPLSSVAPNQPAPVIEIEADVHPLSLIEPQTIRALGVFNYGSDASGTMEPVYGESVSQTVTPSLLEFEKRVTYAESETATGPSFPGTWSLIGNVAREATLTSVRLEDNFPSNFQITSFELVRPAGGNLSLSGPAPGGFLEANWSQVSGSAQNADSEILIEVHGYISEYDVQSDLVLSPGTGENQSINQFQGSYGFERVGVDPEGGYSVAGSSNTVVVDTLTVALQKDASIVADVLPGGLSPEDTVEFALNIQVSDFKTVDQLQIADGLTTDAGLVGEADVLGDGLTFDDGFVPTYSVSMGGETRTGAFSLENMEVIENPEGHPLGSSQLSFDLSQQLIDDAHFAEDGVLKGAALAGGANSGTIAQIRYRATVDGAFDSPVSGDASVDVSDLVFNDVDVVARDLVDSILVGDTSNVELEMEPVTVRHAIERIVTVEGTVIEDPVETPFVSPGDEVTLALRFSVPTGDVEDLELSNFLPYCLLSVSDVNGDGVAGDQLQFNPIVSTTPEVGQITYGTADEYSSNYSANGLPDFTVSVIDNSFTLDYGSIDSPSNADQNGDGVYEFELYYTVIAGRDQLPDEFRMTSLAQLTHGSTNAGSQDHRAYTGLSFSRSEMEITKGIVASDNPSATISPEASGLYQNAGANGNIVGASAGDLLTFAITVSNRGSDPISVLNIIDLLPAGLDASAARIVSVKRADGSALTMEPAVDGLANSADEQALFSGGLALNSAIEGNYLAGGSASSNAFADETLVVLLEVPIEETVAPNAYFENEATAQAWYSPADAINEPYLEASDTASIRAESIAMEKNLIAGYAGDDSSTSAIDVDGQSIDVFTIGEIVTYEIEFVVPFGVATNAVLTDPLPVGLETIAVNGVRAAVVSMDSGITSSQLSAGSNDVNSSAIQAGSNSVEFAFGTLTRPVDGDGSVKTIRVRLHALVQDDAINLGGLDQLNQATLTWEGGSASASSQFTVVRPNLVLDKEMTPMNGDPVQGGTTMQVELTMSNLGDAQEVSAAHDIVLEDLIQSDFFDTNTITEVDTPEGFTFSTEASEDDVKVVYSGGLIDRGDTYVFRFNVDLVADLELLTSLDNTGSLVGTSLPAIPFSLVESTETAVDLASVATAVPTVVKSALSTSESHTSDQPLQVTVGERVVYRLKVEVPDGVVPAMSVLDRVPAGMDFVGSNPDANLAFPGVGYSISGPLAQLMEANFEGITDTDPTPSDSSGTDGNGIDVSWNFGSFVNSPDGDDTNDFFNVDLEMVVLDVSSVVDQSALRNRARIVAAGMPSGAGWSNRVSATVVEPQVSLSKTIPESGLEGGDVFTVQLAIENVGTAEAYDLVLVDPIPSEFFKTNEIVLSPNNPAGWNLSLVAGDPVVVRIESSPGQSLGIDEIVNFEFTVTANDTVPVATSILNTATLDQYTTLDDSLTHPAGIDERVTGGITASDDIIFANAGLELTFVSSSEGDTSDTPGLPDLTFGERAIVRVDVDLPDGTFVNPILTLELPVGLDFVGSNSSAELSFPGSGYDGFYGSLASSAGASFSHLVDGDSTASSSMTNDGSGVDVSFVFNEIVNLPDGDSNNDDFYFYVEVVCVDEDALIGHGATPSQFSVGVRMAAEGAASDSVAGGVAFQVVEPQLTIGKSMLGMSADRPDLVTVEIEVSNTGLSPAHDVVIEDALDLSVFDADSVVPVSVPEGYVFSNTDGQIALRSDSTSIAVGERVVTSFEVLVLATAISPLINTAVVAESSSLNHAVDQPAAIGERAGAQVEAVAELAIPSLSLLKKVIDLEYTGEPLRAGDEIEYTLTVRNEGGATATAIELLDSIPEYTSYVPNSLVIDGEPSAVSSTDLVIDLGTLAASESQDVVFRVKVDTELPAEARSIENSASVTFAERTMTVVSDNDPTGHDPVTDDGVDSELDADELTSNDDPTILPLLQAAITARSYLAFEDLKNRGWSDWDHNDLLLDITTHYITDVAGNVKSAIVLYQIIARGAAYEAQVYLTIPFTGGGQWKTEYLQADGTSISSALGAVSESMTAQVFASTREALPPYLEGYYDWGASRTERFDPTEPGRRAVVHLTLDNPSANPLSGFSQSPHDTWAHMVTSGEDVHRVQYALGNTQVALEGPLAGRNLPLVLEFEEGFDWSAERVGVYDSHPEYVDYVKSGGTTHLDWWRTYDETLVWVDADGNVPGVANTFNASSSSFWSGIAQGLSGASMESSPWPKELGGLVAASPVLRDLNDDGSPEILITSMDGNVYIYDKDGDLLPGWPQAVEIRETGTTLDLALRASPGVGDIDGDDELDIVVGAPSGRLYAWGLDGVRKSTFPVYLGGSIKSVCAVVDLDDDGSAEIVVHSGNSQLHVLNGSGQSLAGWPKALGGDHDQFGSWIMGSSPVVFDLELDGSLQIAVGSTAGKVHIFNVDGTEVAGWPVSTGDWVYNSVSVVDLDGDYEPEIVAGSGDNKVYAWNSDGTLFDGFPVELDGSIVGSVASADLVGGSEAELVIATMNGSVYVLDVNGQTVEGWPQTGKGAFIASPILVDVDGDDRLDVVAASRDNWLYSWDAHGVAIPAVTFKTNDWIESTPVAGDVDGDGKVELLYASFDQTLNLMDLASDATVGNLAWSSFRGDAATAGDAVATDADGDGLPDALELVEFGSLEISGSDDSDGDGTSNASEWIAGTALNDGSDYFVLRSQAANLAQGKCFILNWQARAGRTYKVYSCGSLSGDDTWELVQVGAEQYADGTVEMNWQIDLESDVPRQFFRVVIERGDTRE